MPDSGRLVASDAVSMAPRMEYLLYVTTPGAYTVWVRASAVSGWSLAERGDSCHNGRVRLW